jgi:GT2 family glycosyltransferase
MPGLMPATSLHRVFYILSSTTGMSPTSHSIILEATEIHVNMAPELAGNFILRYAYGACLGIHRSIFEKIGLFDERFFLQLEETEFYTRARASGSIAVCNLGVQIFHKESRAFGGISAPIKTYYATRNHMLPTSESQRGWNKLREWKYLY